MAKCGKSVPQLPVTHEMLYTSSPAICVMEKTTYVGKTSTTLRSRMNNHISGCRNSRTSDIFDIHVYHCGLKNNKLRAPFFKVFAFMSLTSSDKLIVHKKSLQRRGYDTLNR